MADKRKTAQTAQKDLSVPIYALHICRFQMTPASAGNTEIADSIQIQHTVQLTAKPS
jgi:hypothetical protein